MMTQEEWLRQFEAQNGRPPSQEEYTAAWNQGAFIAPESGLAPVNGGNQTPKKPKIGLIIGIVAGILALLLLGTGGYFFYSYNAGNIDGNWQNRELEEELYQTVEDELSKSLTNYDLSIDSFFGEPKVELTVKEDQAKLVISYKVDAEEFSKDLLNIVEQEMANSLDGYADAYDLTEDEMKSVEEAYKGGIPTQEELQELFEETIQDTVKKENLTYDRETGLVSGEIFQGKVNRLAKTITITEYNENLLLDDVDKGETLPFTKSGSRLTFEDEDGETLVFEKAS